MMLSTTEIQYKSLVDGSERNNVASKALLTKFNNGQRPTKLFCDNYSTKKLVKNPILHTKYKHIELHYHYI
jgi:hypothetical protein